MHLDQRKYDEEPLKRGEKIFILIISALFLFMMSMEIFSNYEPRKLSALLFVLSWIPLLFIHEFGHAMMAKLLGWNVTQINIGIGQRLFKTHFLGIPMDIRAIPLEGFVQYKQTSNNNARYKHALVYFSGPGIELLIFFIVLFIYGIEGMFTITDNYIDIALQSFAFAALAGAILNLIPMSIETKDGTIPNDGLGIIISLLSDNPDHSVSDTKKDDKE